MFASIVRIALLLAAVFGIYKLYPRFQPVLEPIIKPEVLGAKIIHPAIKTINGFLPDNFQIPSSRQSDSEGGQVDGAATTANTIVNTIIEDVKKKAGDIAQEQIDAAKQEAGKAFCQVLIEKVRTECGP